MYRINPANTDHGKCQLMVPRHKHHKFISDFHCPNHMGHFGINSTINKITGKYYWKGLYKDVVRFINNCQTCNELKGATKKAPIFPIPLTEPFEEIVCDILGPLPITKRGNRYIVAFIDRYSSWVEAFPVQTIETQVVARLFVEEVIFRYGCCRKFRTDQGSNLVSKIMKAVCERLSIEKKDI